MNNESTFSTFGTVNEGASYGGKIGRQRPFAIDPTTDGQAALVAAGLNWKINTVKLGEILDTPNDGGVVISQRSDTGAVVGANGRRHHAIHNTVLAELGDTIRQYRPDAQYVGGGDKDGGSTCFLLMEMPEGIDLGGGDVIYRNLLLHTSHDGGTLSVTPTMFRPFCTNQWGSLLRTAGKSLVRVTHTASAQSRIAGAHMALANALRVFDEWDNALQELMKQPARMTEYAVGIVGERPEAGRALTEWESRLDRLWAEYSQDFNANLVGTAAGIVLAAQGADEHTARCKRGMRDQQRIGRVINGSYPLAQRALELVSQ